MIRGGLSLVFNRDEIDSRVGALAVKITEDYNDLNPVIVSILKGSIVFLSDLVRKLDFDLELDFIRLASYGTATMTSGRVEVVNDIALDIKNRHVLVVEDIIDTGLTIRKALDHLGEKRPASIRLCTLLDKPWRRLTKVSATYTGFTAPDRFLVGYGLDYAERYRNLPEIYAVDRS